MFPAGLAPERDDEGEMEIRPVLSICMPLAEKMLTMIMLLDRYLTSGILSLDSGVEITGETAERGDKQKATSDI